MVQWTWWKCNSSIRHQEKDIDWISYTHKKYGWGNTSNPLKFAIDQSGSVWFTEWTENKIGLVSREKMDKIPILLSTSKDEVIVDTKTNVGDSVDVFVYKSNLNSSNSFSTFGGTDKLFNTTMFATSSIAKNGQLWNITNKFDKSVFSASNAFVSSLEPLKTTLYLSPTETVVPGNYTLTVSARYNDEITYSKVIDLYVI